MDRDNPDREYNRRESDRRLEKIESKLDDITKSFVAIARIEEKMKSVEQELEYHSDTANKMTNKIDKIENDLIATTESVKLLHKILWLALTIGATVIATNLTSQIGGG